MREKGKICLSKRMEPLSGRRRLIAATQIRDAAQEPGFGAREKIPHLCVDHKIGPSLRHMRELEKISP